MDAEGKLASTPDWFETDVLSRSLCAELCLLEAAAAATAEGANDVDAEDYKHQEAARVVERQTLLQERDEATAACEAAQAACDAANTERVIMEKRADACAQYLRTSPSFGDLHSPSLHLVERAHTVEAECEALKAEKESVVSGFEAKLSAATAQAAGNAERLASNEPCST